MCYFKYEVEREPLSEFLLSRYNWDSEKLVQVKIQTSQDVKQISILSDDFDQDNLYFTVENKLYKVSFKDEEMTFVLDKLKPVLELRPDQEIFQTQFQKDGNLLWVGCKDFLRLVDLQEDSTLYEEKVTLSKSSSISILDFESLVIM